MMKELIELVTAPALETASGMAVERQMEPDSRFPKVVNSSAMAEAPGQTAGWEDLPTVAPRAVVALMSAAVTSFEELTTIPVLSRGFLNVHTPAIRLNLVRGGRTLFTSCGESVCITRNCHGLAH